MRGEDLSDRAPLGLEVVGAGGEIRRFGREAFPVALGGEDSALALASPEGPSPSPSVSLPLAAYLGLDGDEVFLQPAGGGPPVVCNGALVTASRWLRDGDLVRIGAHRLRCREVEGGLRLTLEESRPAAEPATPRLVPPPRPGSAGAENDGEPGGPPAGGAGPRIKPLAYTPPVALATRRLRLALPWRSLSLLALVAILVLPAWFLFTSRSVDFQIEPEPDEMKIEGGVLRPRVGDGYLLRPGAYRVLAQLEGHRPLDERVEVSSEPRQTIRLSLSELPGLLDIRTRPASGAEVWIDGSPVGPEPVVGAEIEKGERRVRVTADGYLEHTQTVLIEGFGRRQELSAELVPLLAAVEFNSRPAGARVFVDGEEIGVTPLTRSVLAGVHRLEVRLPRHRTARSSFVVEPDTPLAVPRVDLVLADGGLSLTSEPAGASVTVDGSFRGTTPLELDLAPERAHEVVVTKAGFTAQTLSVELEPEQARELHVELDARLGEVAVSARPAGAELLVDGERVGEANQVLRLIAVPHELEVRLAGFLPHRETITPRPGLRQTLEVTLETAEEKASKSIEPVIQTAQGLEMRLIGPGSLQMGASRREPGRRANETLRSVEISRPFYLATQEVTNRQFRQFADGHRSGRAGHVSLETDHHPVVRVSWDDAVRYCNWLSAKDSLPSFYRQSGGAWVAVTPHNRGYRLPLESEWAWAARYPDGKNPLKYPWGDSLPVPKGAGNYADVAARALLRNGLSGYDDGFVATAPVDSFGPNALGLFNLGGNVAEWVHDFYSLYAGGSGAKERDPAGPSEGEFHVIRGSSWMHDSVTELRLSYRDYGRDPRPDVGFRIARFLESTR